MTSALRIAKASIGVGLTVLAIKTLAWWVTGSIALFSDALESIVNVATATAALVALRVAHRPADDKHPFGHHKAEYVSAVLEGVLIVLAAVLIMRSSVLGLLNPQPLDAPFAGLAINLIASIINGVWAFVLLRAGREHTSPALAADGRHLMSDVVSSVGVTIGVAAAVLTGWLWLDPVLAAMVAVNVLWSGWIVIRGSVGGLMDESVPEMDLEKMRALVLDSAKGAIEAHDLRARHAGAATFIEFHLVVPEDMTVFDAHVICDRVEAALRDGIDHCTVTIHVEPEHKAKPSAALVI
ncbi:Cation diffusion facilitator family transporter [Sulfitobacter noctilucae]|uniref:cation diffusion facilitator family transporter n=1 Tax=Sulfitobacter noctilucae TaxID=1342302 RepID=UPI0004698BE4|nr:cation diffusion facilitator family transporter [Sulfitobacter noctilucae]KIN65386.1 Cation diffusion facilitator family transporter [Sulfitobacter noctilucae]